jgi:protein-disulfide isomerase
MIVYSDFQCPFCGRFTRDVLPEIERRYVATGQVAIAFRHLPLPMHALATRAAVMTECAGHQGKFWEMHDLLFAQETLDEEALSTSARSLNLDPDGFEQCLSDQTITAQVKASGEHAARLGIRSTPAFLLGQKTDDGRVKISRVLSGALPIDDFVENLAGR